jgi:broad specificity phosphatase PhoE
MDRLLLIRHGLTAETRRAAFPSTSGEFACEPCEGLEWAGLEQATALRAHLPEPDRTWSSHARRARETARGLGLWPEADGDLAECDFGRWAGLTPPEVYERDPDAVAAWYADPGFAVHAGETLAHVRARARRVMERAAALGGTTVAVTHGGFIKAALLEALGLPDLAVWRLDAAPASVTELHPTSGSWRLVRLNWTPWLARHAEAMAT